MPRDVPCLGASARQFGRSASAWRSTLRAAGRAGAVLCAVGACLMGTGCGGGSDQAPDSQSLPDASQLDGAACPDCRPGRLSGVVSSGGALADADVQVFDAQGRSAVTRTDAQGRYDVSVTALAGPLLVQVIGLAGGRPVRLHSACRGAEIGNRAVNVTPLTELIVAQALAGRPGDLLRDTKVDFFRLDAAALRLAEISVETLVRPVLDAVGVPQPVDLRVTPFQADGTGIDQALRLLVLEPAASGYVLRHVAMPLANAQPLSPEGIGSAQPLPALSAATATAARSAVASLADIERQLAEWTRLFAAGVPEAAPLRALLADDFADGGLDRDSYIGKVLQRRDATELGGFSYAGTRWHDARIVGLTDERHLRLRVRLSLPPPHAPRYEDMRWVKAAPGWQALGDGAVGRAQVRNLAVLGPLPLDEAALRRLPGVACPALFEPLPQSTIAERCRVDGGAFDLPPTGVLDLGRPGDGQFGLFGLFRSSEDTPGGRLVQYRTHSRLLAEPSRRVERHLVFELDARRVDPRAVRALVVGPGLPAAGLLLEPPAVRAGAPQAEHWMLASDSDDDWQGVRIGSCEAAVDDTEARACARAWPGVSAGAAYRFVLFDGAAAIVGQIDVQLPDSPMTAPRLEQQANALFARFRLADQSAHQPTLARLLAAPEEAAEAGDVLALDLPWAPPGDPGQRVTEARVDWWRAGFPPASGNERVQRRQFPTAPSRLVQAVAARPGFRTGWLVARLVAEDPMGNRYLHFVAPNNPY